MRATRAIVLTSIVEVAQFLVFGAVEAFLALYAASVGIPAWQIGIILGAQLLSVIVVKPLMGGLSDRLGRRAIIFPGLALGVATSPCSPWPPMSTCSRCSACCMAWPSRRSLPRPRRWWPSHERRPVGASVGVLRTIMDIGQTVGPVLTGFLVAAAGYGVAFPALASIIAASAAIFVFLPRPVASAA